MDQKRWEAMLSTMAIVVEGLSQSYWLNERYRSLPRRILNGKILINRGRGMVLPIRGAWGIFNFWIRDCAHALIACLLAEISYCVFSFLYAHNAALL